MNHFLTKLFVRMLAVLCIAICGLAQAAIPASERAVLDALYAQTDGAHWRTNSGWEGAAGTECSWQGIGCNDDQTHVISIYFGGYDVYGDFIGNNLVGTLPKLDGLTHLALFFVYGNHLTGTIPAISGLSDLADFEVDVNQLTGSIPDLTGLSHLQYFRVDGNLLTGNIPAMTGLSKLQEFHANDNQLEGTIPSLAGLTSLQYFNVDGNHLIGAIPDLTGLPLQSFFVGNNSLEGDIPVAPASLLPRQSTLCNNPLNHDPSSAWDAATGVAPWYSICSLHPCVASATTACLQGNRFAVNVTWKYYDGITGPANVMYFSGVRAGNDESSMWTFQTPTNFEMSVKVLSRCAHGWGNTFQVLVGALTDQGWAATVRDTLNESTYVFSNPTPGVIPAVINNDHIEDCP